MKLLTVDDLSKILNVPKSTIYHFSYQGKLPCLKIGGKMLRFEESAILAWIKTFEHQPAVQNQPAVKEPGKRGRGRPKDSTKVKTSLVEIAKKELKK